MQDETVDRFISALGELERDRSLEPITACFHEDCQLQNLMMSDPLRGRAGAEEFWRTYRESFDRVRSDFREVVRGDGAAALEWTSEGTMADGHPFSYAGVSVLTGDDRIRRFAAYFDPAVLQVRTER